MQLIDILLQITIFLIMIGVGSSIILKDLKEVFRRPRNMIIGLVLQVLVLPLIAILIASLIPVSAYYKIGIVILAACPGGAMSNFISYLVKADTALSVGLTSTNSFVTMITIPAYTALSFFLFLGNSVSISLPVESLVINVLLFVIMPVVFGMIFRYKFEDVSMSFRRPIKIISTTLLLLVFLVKFFARPDFGGSNIGIDIILLLFPYLLILNFAGLFTGYLTSKAIGLSRKTALTMGIEVGLQNTVLTLLVADVILKNPLIGHPALVYAMFSFITTFLFAFFFMNYKSINTEDAFLN